MVTSGNGSTGFWAGDPRLVLCLTTPPQPAAQVRPAVGLGECRAGCTGCELAACAGGLLSVGSSCGTTLSLFPLPAPQGWLALYPYLGPSDQWGALLHPRNSSPCPDHFDSSQKYCSLHIRELRFFSLLIPTVFGNLNTFSLYFEGSGVVCQNSAVKRSYKDMEPRTLPPAPSPFSCGAGSTAPRNALWGIPLPSELPPVQCSSCQEPGAAPAPVPGLSLLLVTDVRVWWGGQVY